MKDFFFSFPSLLFWIIDGRYPEFSVERYAFSFLFFLGPGFNFFEGFGFDCLERYDWGMGNCMWNMERRLFISLVSLHWD